MATLVVLAEVAPDLLVLGLQFAVLVLGDNGLLAVYRALAWSENTHVSLSIVYGRNSQGNAHYQE